MKRCFIVLCTLLLTTGSLWAEAIRLDPVVVTATRTATPLSQIASSVTVITAEEIEAKQQTQILEVLRSVPGVNIIHSGSIGGQTSVRLRGTDNKHTLVLIDGIEFRDASTIGGGADLANLSTDNVAQIEVVRGAQSVLYGSDAIGGVINIITKKGSKQPEGFASVEGGSYNTWREAAGFSVGSETTSSSFSISRTDSDGFSSYNEDDGFGEDDGYKNTNISFNVGINLTKKIELNLDLHLANSEYDFDTGYYDTFFNYTQADTDAVVDSQELTSRAEGVFHLLDRRWTLVLGAAVTDTNRTTTGTYDNYEYDGEIEKVDLQNTFHLNQQHTIVVGMETEKEEYESSYGDSGDVRAKAIYLQEQLSLGRLSAAVGVRYDSHEEFGSETTWRFAPTYTLNKLGTRLKGSVGTGFKAPSLFQLYYPYGGNKNLNPETSLGWDIGFEQPLLNNSVIVEVTWFHNDIDDYIDWFDDGDFDFYDGDGYQNIKELKTSGIESVIEWYPAEILDISFAYTYTDTEDENGARKARSPLHKGVLGFNLTPVDKLQIHTNVIYTSERDDGATNETLKDYILVNLTTSYQINDNFKIFGRVDNLFDKDYEEVAGYGTAGLSGYAGIKLSF